MAKEDTRTKKTKKLLRQGLIDLMQQKAVSEITVKELTELIDVNRGTFYKYYKDVSDMVRQIENHMAMEFQAIVDKPINDDIETYPKPLLIFIYYYLKENADMCAVLLGPNGNKDFVKKMTNIIRIKFTTNFENVLNAKSQRYFEYFASFIGDGCTSVFQTWLEKGMVESPEEMADVTIKLILHPFKVLL